MACRIVRRRSGASPGHRPGAAARAPGARAVPSGEKADGDRRQLNRQRQSIEAATNGGDRRCVWHRGMEDDVSTARARATKSCTAGASAIARLRHIRRGACHPLRQRQRSDREPPFAGNVEEGPAGDKSDYAGQAARIAVS